MNKAKGNMYEFITHTWNPIKGKCYHNCSYCYMEKIRRRFNQSEKKPHLDAKELGVNLGSGNIIFVGSSIDIFVSDLYIPHEWKHMCFIRMNRYENNRYLMQTKNPQELYEYISKGYNESNLTICVTIETNRQCPQMGSSPEINERVKYAKLLKAEFITIEPIMDFDTDVLVKMIKEIQPKQVNIGADSGNNHLPEPEPDKIRELIKELEAFTKVHLKPNLKRLL